MTKTYSTKANAQRAAKTLISRIPDEFVVSAPYALGDDAWTFDVTTTVAEVTVAPEVKVLLEPFTVIYPAPPATNKPAIRRNPMKPYANWDFSDCDTPVAVAREIFEYYYTVGRIDERKEVLDAAMQVGVQRNTAHTQYRRFRIAKGLPGAVGIRQVK